MESLGENMPLDLKLKAKSKLKASLDHCTRTCSQAQAHLMWSLACLSSISLPLIILLLSRFLNPMNNWTVKSQL